MTRFVRAANPIWYIPDLTGLPLNGNDFAFFLENDFPYLPQAVFQDPDGLNPWSDPIQFDASGTLPNNLYFDDTLTYRIEIRGGPTQADPLIWLIQNFQPGQGTGSGNSILTAPNIATNPQFSDIFFTSPFTITTAGTYDIAPGWQLVLTGTGSTTVTRTPIAGTSNITENPSYYVTFANTGWTTARLVTTFANNGALFANGSVAVSFLAFATTTPQTLSVVYSPNGPSNNQTIFSGTIAIGNLAPYAGFIPIVNPSLNTNLGTAANVQVYFALPVAGTISLTNIMLTGQSTPVSGSFTVDNVPTFAELPFERIVDEEFHVFKNSLLTQSKRSLLTGWIFGLNPFQAQNNSALVLPPNALVPSLIQTQYIADQTILRQQAANIIKSGQADSAHNFGLQLQAIGAGSPVDNRLAIIQYIDISTVKPNIGQYVSCLVRAVLANVNSIAVPIKMRLIYNTSLPPNISPTEPIASWTAGQDPTFAAGWTAIVPQNDPAYILGNTFANSATDFPSYSFNKFLLPSVSGGYYLGVVIYTMANLDNAIGSENSIFFDRISLVQNDFAIDTAETFDESTRKCQFYFSKSYPLTIPGGTVTFLGSILKTMTSNFNSNLSHWYFASFSFPFKQIMRAPPLVLSFYSTANPNTPNKLNGGILRNGAFVAINNMDFGVSNWNFTISQDEVVGTATSTTSAQITLADQNPGDQSVLFIQYTADSRLGLNN